MKSEISINLLRTQSTLTQEEVLLLLKVRVITVGVTVLILVSGLFVGLSYAAAKLRYNSLTEQRTQATQKITQAAKKEALLLSLKSRLLLVNRGLAIQYPWENILTVVSQIAPSPKLRSLSVDSQQLTLDIMTSSLEDMQSIVNQIQELSKENKLKNSTIQSLISQSNGQIEGRIQFTPIF